MGPCWVGDLDGDNADDFIIGGNEFYSGVSRGAVILISGRTGIPLRPPWVYGRARTLSSRDGQDLVQISNVPGVSEWGWSYADLGVQPGNPYPVFAIMDRPTVGGTMSWPRIRAVRCSPVGTSLVGQACASPGVVPTIGVRRVAPVVPATVDTSRIVLGSAPTDSLALCVVAPFAATTGGGVTVPAQLDPLGIPGCTLLVPPVITALRLTGSSGMDRGYAAVDLAVPFVAAGGTRYAAQWVVLDPLSLGYAVTARYEFRVQ